MTDLHRCPIPSLSSIPISYSGCLVLHPCTLPILMCVLFLIFPLLCFLELTPTFCCHISICHTCPPSVSISVPCLSLLPHLYPLWPHLSPSLSPSVLYTLSLPITSSLFPSAPLDPHPYLPSHILSVSHFCPCCPLVSPLFPIPPSVPSLFPTCPSSKPVSTSVPCPPPCGSLVCVAPSLQSAPSQQLLPNWLSSSVVLGAFAEGSPQGHPGPQTAAQWLDSF